jgi:hypothetical protein
VATQNEPTTHSSRSGRNDVSCPGTNGERTAAETILLFFSRTPAGKLFQASQNRNTHRFGFNLLPDFTPGANHSA